MPVKETLVKKACFNAITSKTCSNSACLVSVLQWISSMSPHLTRDSQKSTRSMDGIDLHMEIANVLNAVIFPTDMSAATLVETGNGKRSN